MARYEMVFNFSRGTATGFETVEGHVLVPLPILLEGFALLPESARRLEACRNSKNIARNLKSNLVLFALPVLSALSVFLVFFGSLDFVLKQKIVE